MDFDDFGFQAAPAPEPERAPPVEQPVAEHDPMPPLRTAPPQPRPGRSPAPLHRSASPPHRARAKAGLGVMAAAAGLGVGAVLAGPLGGLAGLASVGTVRNLYRAQAIASTDPAERDDGARSFALGVIGLAIVGALGYKLWSSKE